MVSIIIFECCYGNIKCQILKMPFSHSLVPRLGWCPGRVFFLLNGSSALHSQYRGQCFHPVTTSEPASAPTCCQSTKQCSPARKQSPHHTTSPPPPLSQNFSQHPDKVWEGLWGEKQGSASQADLWPSLLEVTGPAKGLPCRFLFPATSKEREGVGRRAGALLK